MARLAQRRRPSVRVASAPARVDRAALDEHLRRLGTAGLMARRLDGEAERGAQGVASLSPLSADLAVQYLERLARPIPSLSSPAGAGLVTRAYMGHMAVEADGAAYGAGGDLTLMSVPPLRHGRPPQDLLRPVVKASRFGFDGLRHVPAPVWEGFVYALACRAHEEPAGEGGYLAVAVVDGLARFGWVLRQVDLRYGLEPEGR